MQGGAFRGQAFEHPLCCRFFDYDGLEFDWEFGKECKGGEEWWRLDGRWGAGGGWSRWPGVSV